MNVNDHIRNETIQRSIDLERFKDNAVKRMLPILREIEADILVVISKEGLTEYKENRLADMLSQVRAITKAVYAKLGNVLDKDLEELTRLEIKFRTELLNGSVGVSWAASPAVGAVYAAANARPFQGKLLREYYRDLPAAVAEVVSRQIKLGYTEGETINQIVNRVKRTTRGKANKWGVTLIRTAVQHYASFASRETSISNADALKGRQWVSTLDTATSAICRQRDGKIYSINSKVEPPAHFNCRSTMVDVLKHWSRQKFNVPQEMRSSIDGQVPSNVTYPKWFKAQGVARQNEVLGVKKAQLYRNGGLELDKFATRTGNDLPLSVLETRYPVAWNRAFAA